MDEADVKRVLRSLLYEARRQRDKGPCQGCDPGNEGAEVWSEFVEEIENLLAARAKREG